MTPIAKPESKRTVRFSLSGKIMEIARHAIGYFTKQRQVAAVKKRLIRQFHDHRIPHRPVAPGIAVSGCRDNTRQNAVLTLGGAYHLQPMFPNTFDGKILYHMFCRYCRVACPSVFLTVRTVGRNMHKIGKVADTGAFLQSVCNRVGTEKRTALANVTVLHKHCDSIFRNLFLICANNKKVTCAVIRERRDVFLDTLSFAYIDIPLAKAVRIEHSDAFKVDTAVLVAVFCRLQKDLLPFSSANAELRHTGRIFRKLENKPFFAGFRLVKRRLRMLFRVRALFSRTFGGFVITFVYFDRFQFFGNDDRLGIVCNRFAARRLTDIGVLPRAVVKIRHIPTGNFRIRVIEFAAAEIVEKDR